MFKSSLVETNEITLAIQGRIRDFYFLKKEKVKLLSTKTQCILANARCVFFPLYEVWTSPKRGPGERPDPVVPAGIRPLFIRYGHYGQYSGDSPFRRKITDSVKPCIYRHF